MDARTGVENTGRKGTVLCVCVINLPPAPPAPHVWAHSPSGRAEEETKTSAPTRGNRTKPPDITASSLVTIPTELRRLRLRTGSYGASQHSKWVANQ